ncbi:N-alpha-acetyltransferase 80-like [Toxorhynchites rutilus septentrionalis]|uniref:N-alpha-acetyltransferase 80-like n=1 Tax=Toxorhynchites rutilus septentrionalis TaxID=329112 RepID=UPI00247B1392|nr:N-alpha-acetyltransferase 80-like [Toxorhynchites rutilus septentrionalis]XP_055616592.1 N-alpha-acetyltransferase 80-like [Toxorhynchites rutilus septentrionalis]
MPVPSYSVVPIHHHQQLFDQCVHLINSEWPRSYTARLWSLKASKDTLPTSFVLIKQCVESDTNGPTVLAHAKLSPVPADEEAVLVESVVVDRRCRGQGLGRLLMNEIENHCFCALRLKTIYLSTIDQDGFYNKLGYTYCKAINMFGTRISSNNCTKKIWMVKRISDYHRKDSSIGI